MSRPWRGDAAAEQNLVPRAGEHEEYTAESAVEAPRRRWQYVGEPNCPDARSLLITAGRGGSNGYRVRLWKWESRASADELNIPLALSGAIPLAKGSQDHGFQTGRGLADFIHRIAGIHGRA